MALMIDQKSENWKGEQKVWEGFKDYLPNNIVVYNNRQLNGQEYDFCLLIDNKGVFIVEVKGWISSKITVKGPDEIHVEGYNELQRSPLKQANAYRFSYLNWLKKKFGVSPLVVGMVSYPFISREEYLDRRLDIVSEEELTLFKEDFQDSESLMKKFDSAFSLMDKNLPYHQTLKTDVIQKIRSYNEPDFHTISTSGDSGNYSWLSAFPEIVSQVDISEIISAYCNGVKQIVFVETESAYDIIIEKLNNVLMQHNIQPDGNNLRLNFDAGIKKKSDRISIFNFELYLIQNLKSFFNHNLRIIDGKYSDQQKNSLIRLMEVSSFNFQQYSIEHAPSENNTLVEAGAGTGKTYVMVSRIGYLCNMEKNPITSLKEELAMVTFTNDAADNMKKRLKQLFVNYYLLTGDTKYLMFSDEVNSTNISTIHKFVIELLRKLSCYTGLGVNFEITTDEYLRQNIYNEHLSTFIENKREEDPNFSNQLAIPVYELRSKLMMLADQLLQKSINLENISDTDLGTPIGNLIPYMNELFTEVVFPSEKEYRDELQSRNGLELKNCIILLNEILTNHPDQLNEVKFRYMFIDEFQDTDDVQIEIFQKLQKAFQSKCRLFVVGDLKQSIYRFRGATLSAFTRIKECKMFPWDEFFLNINYRTDSRLLEKYHEIFTAMGEEGYLPYDSQDQLTGAVITSISDEAVFEVIPCHKKNEDDFYDKFVQTIKDQLICIENLMRETRLSLEERTIAILVRSNWQIDTLVKESDKRGLVIITDSGGDLYQLPSTQDLYKLTLAFENPCSPVYLVNFIESNYFDLELDYRKLYGLKDEEKLEILYDVLDQFFQLRMNKTWSQLLDNMNTQPVLYVLKNIFDHLKPWKQYSGDGDSQRYYIENFDYLLECILQFSENESLTLEKVNKFLQINILTSQKKKSREKEVNLDGIRVVCMTVHKSKGLEFGTVILPYTDTDISNTSSVKLEANYIDSKLSYNVLFDNKCREKNDYYDEEIERNEQTAEESRILYVALTRTIRNCIWIKNLDRDVAISWASMLEE